MEGNFLNASRIDTSNGNRQLISTKAEIICVFYLIALSAHCLQYFSISVTPCPTSKEASCVAGLSQVIQYLAFLFTPMLAKGFSEIKIRIIYLVMLPTSAINREAAIIAPATIKNLLVLFLLSVIAH